MQKREYNTAKAIAMLLVVFGHAQVFSFGNVLWVFPMNVFRERLEYVISYIYCFHVPMFFLVSGALFRTTEEKQMSCGLVEFLKKKARRLLIPYAGCFLLLLVPVRYLVGYYPLEFPESIQAVLLDMVGLGDNGHLWFLPTLFQVYVLFYCIDAGNNRHKNTGILTSTIILYLIALGIPDRFDTSIRYLLWFTVGYYFDLLCYEFLRSWTAQTLIPASVFCLATAVFCFCTGKRVYGIGGIPISMLGTILGACGVLLASFACTGKQWKLFRALEKNSYSVYLLHDPVNYLFLFAVDRIVCLSALSEGQYVVIILIKVIVSLGLSIVICQCGACLKKGWTKISGDR